MRVRRRRAALVAVVGLVLTACGSNDEAATVAETAAAPAPTVAESPQVAPDVEAVMVPTADGTDLDFNSLRGQDVLLWFWAPW